MTKEYDLSTNSTTISDVLSLSRDVQYLSSRVAMLYDIFHVLYCSTPMMLYRVSTVHTGRVAVQFKQLEKYTLRSRYGTFTLRFIHRVIFCSFVLCDSAVALYDITEDSSAPVKFSVHLGRGIPHKFCTNVHGLSNSVFFNVRSKDRHWRFCTYIYCMIQLLSCTNLAWYDTDRFCRFFLQHCSPNGLTITVS